MKKTFDEIVKFSDAAAAFINEFGTDPKKKLLYAVNKNYNKTKVIVDKVNTEMNEYYSENHNDLAIEYASVDDKGNVIQSDKGTFSYTKDNLKLFTKKRAELSKKIDEMLAEAKLKEYDVDVYFATSIDMDLTLDQQEAFTGFVLEPTLELVK